MSNPSSPATIAATSYEDLASPPVENPYVLSAAAHHALAAAPAAIRVIHGVYPLAHPAFVATVSVMPGATPGASYITVNLRRRPPALPDTAVRLFANVRTSWLNAACGVQPGEGERAILLSAALCDLAAIPGQQTVAIMTGHPTPIRELAALATLLREAIGTVVPPGTPAQSSQAYVHAC